jgi:hypothetical protein
MARKKRDGGRPLRALARLLKALEEAEEAGFEFLRCAGDYDDPEAETAAYEVRGIRYAAELHHSVLDGLVGHRVGAGGGNARKGKAATGPG